MAATPRRSVARKAPQKQIPVDKAKQEVLGHIANGLKVADAMAAVGRKEETYRDWMRSDEAFHDEVGRLRAAKSNDDGNGPMPVPDFPEFCEELGQPLHLHQLRMWDAIEGRPPRDIHPSFRYSAGSAWEKSPEQDVAGRVIVNLPPGHAKTTTFSINYATWLIHKNPNIKIIVVCKDMGLATQILGAVKFRLTSPVYRALHAKYAPEGGWKDPDQSWTQTAIYVQGKGDGEKDPTMQALGIGGRIYGARSDVIILDDAVTLANVREFDKQRRWLDQEVESRLDGAGLLALLGTRIAPVDLYSTMREVEDIDDTPVYTYFSMPAVLDEGDGSPDSWVTLWPERFPGRRLRKIRRDESTWALVYQQQDVAEDATFNASAVAASVNGLRFPGPMRKGAVGHRLEGTEGCYIVGGLDPATTGATAMIVTAIDKVTGKRWITDGFNQRNCSPELMRSTIKRLTDAHKINEWVIERNAFQRFLTQDPELKAFLRGRGCRLTEHYTHENKYDADFGIMSMAPLFETCGTPQRDNPAASWTRVKDGSDLIELPSARQNAWVAELINQLVVWTPTEMKRSQKTDLVMALWFTEIAAKRILDRRKHTRTHLDNPYASRRSLRTRTVVNLADYKNSLLTGEAV